MSIQKIVDYVMHTPHNTNPAILKQVINDNISWNDLKDKPFYTETETISVVENYDLGTTEEGFFFYREGITFDIGDLIHIELSDDMWGEYPDISCDIVATDRYGEGATTGIISNTSVEVYCEDGALRVEGNGYRKMSLSFTRETIHKIDAKYLPNVGGGYDLVVDGAECRIVSGSHATVRDKMLRGEVPSVCLLSTYYMESGVIRFQPDNKFTGVSYYTDEDIISISIGEDSYKVHADGTVELYQN